MFCIIIPWLAHGIFLLQESASHILTVKAGEFAHCFAALRMVIFTVNAPGSSAVTRHVANGILTYLRRI